MQRVRLVFCMLLFGSHSFILALDFQFLAPNGSLDQFDLLVPVNGSSYNGSRPEYNANGGNNGGPLVWLTPQNPGNFSKTFNVGWFIWKDPVNFRQKVGNQEVFTSFSTSFEFQIVTTESYGNSGDGLAFFISPRDAPPHDSTGDLLGLVGRSDSAPSPFFAVEFDTHMDAEMQDPSASHVGIDVNSLISRQTINTTGSSLSLYNNYVLRAWVEYNAASHLVQVWIVNRANMTEPRPQYPSLQLSLDLSSVFNGSLDLYVGFSAATGSFYGGHAVYNSWNFSTSNDNLSSPTASTSDIPGSKSISNACIDQCHTGKSPLSPLLIVFPVAAVFIVLLLFVIWRIRRRHKKPEPKEAQDSHVQPRAQPRPDIEMQNKSVPRYRYSELRRATNGFSSRMLVGQGAFSCVYRGTLRVDGSTLVVAVKKMHDGLGEEAAFPSEIKIISSIRHRNLLQLHGWCYHKGKALLVYQYMENGSLDYHLFKHKEAGVRLSSDTRFNILLGVAAALEYLHEGLGECVLHRDVKAANVLLNKDFQPLLGDFGLARLIAHNMMVTMTAAGTPGYLAPETYFTGKATDRADVYSFGVLALEVACGRRVLDAQLPPQEMNLVEWVWLLKQSSKLLDAIDPIVAQSIKTITNDADEIQDDYHDRWRCVLHIGLACCHPLPQYRPSMRQVHQLLKKNTIISLPSTRPDFPYSTNSNSAVMPFSVSASSDFSVSSSFTTLTKSISFGS